MANCMARATICLMLRPRMNFRCVAAILRTDGFLIRDVLIPVDKLVAGALHFTVLSKGGHAGKGKDRGMARRGIVKSLAKNLSPNVDMYNNSLRTAGEAGIPVCHGHGNHLYALLSVSPRKEGGCGPYLV